MSFTRRLLIWFRSGARDLPWRRSRDPYRVWISEIMLQQTQIAAVLPYYERWMKRFPTVDALAAAPIGAVLKSWEGLGDYARARNLHKAATILARDGFPSTLEGWLDLPGVGPYTAAAIASIVSGVAAPVRDGNVNRVLARVLMGDAGIDAFLAKALPADAPGDFNQGLMELGQRVCRPRNPRCGECPVAADCRARKAGAQDRFPVKKAKKAIPHFEIAIGVCRRGGRILVARRKAEGLLGGLWEFPGGKRKRSESYEAALRREFREEVGVDIDVDAHLVTVPHRYSHFSVELHTYLCRHRKGRARAIGNDEVRWVKPADLSKLAFPSANGKILRKLLASLKMKKPQRAAGAFPV